MRCDSASGTYNSLVTEFQSLSGFLMRCDGELVIMVKPHAKVSIPIGFSDAL